MKNDEILSSFLGRYPQLQGIRSALEKAAQLMIQCYSEGGKVLICGNGGSSSDSDHIAGELMKSFEIRRPIGVDLINRLTGAGGERGEYISGKLEQGFPAISLTGQTALITAIGNDIDPSLIFAQQVVVYGNPGDVIIGISCSGNSQNVVDALITARAKGMKVIGLTGESGGRIKDYCDVMIGVPGQHTGDIQELHLPVYHALCRMVENQFFGEGLM